VKISSYRDRSAAAAAAAVVEEEEEEENLVEFCLP